MLCAGTKIVIPSIIENKKKTYLIVFYVIHTKMFQAT